MKFYANLMIKMAMDLFPFARTLISEENRKTLKYISKKIRNLKILKIKSGTKVYSWVIPDEWIMKEAYIIDEKGNKYADFKKNNLHIVYYSTPVNKWFTRKELLKNIFTQKNQPEKIPYVSSYYKKRWGFCLSQNTLNKMKKNKYKAYINSSFKKSFLEIGEYYKKGKNKKEIFFSTYICHPSMANDNISGIVLSSALINYINKYYKKTSYSYRFVFLPETIGSIAYISKKLLHLKKNMLMGFTLSCVGDEREYSIIKSRKENQISDSALLASLIGYKKLKIYSYLERGSDERQYCYPGIDLPVTGFCRSKYHSFDEYHTNYDNFNLVTKKGLEGSFGVFKNLIDACEINTLYPKNKNLCEPNLGNLNLLSTIGKKDYFKNKLIKNILAYSDGKLNLFDLSILLNINIKTITEQVKILKLYKIIE